MEKSLNAEMIKASAQMEIDEFLEDKPEEFKEGFNIGVQYGVEITRKMIELYFEIKI